MRATVLATQLLVWGGLATATAAYGIDHTWAMVGFGLLSAYVQIPLLLLRASPRATRRTRRRRRVGVSGAIAA